MASKTVIPFLSKSLVNKSARNYRILYKSWTSNGSPYFANCKQQPIYYSVETLCYRPHQCFFSGGKNKGEETKENQANNENKEKETQEKAENSAQDAKAETKNKLILKRSQTHSKASLRNSQKKIEKNSFLFTRNSKKKLLKMPRKLKN